MLEIIDLFKTYEGQPLLQGLSLRVDQGETVCLLGASGSGKSTLLRLIAGIEHPDRGDIRWDGQSILSVPTHQRRFGLMFQDYALFPHLSVRENVAFGLRMQRVASAEIRRQAQDALQRVGMAAFAERSIIDLSGGEQQRVALARTLAAGPRLLLLDEPLAALDRTLRQQLLAELRKILKDTGIPSIYVTHDQEEGYSIADRIILLLDGQIQQTGTPEEVYRHPGSLQAASFLDQNNRIKGRIKSVHPALVVETEAALFQVDELPVTPDPLKPGDDVTLLLRDAEIADPSTPTSLNEFSALVTDEFFRETGYLVVCQIGDLSFKFNLDGYQPGADRVKLSIPASAINIFRE
jgi:spermidine/putrescine transport system ATP-binding protein